MMILYKIKNYLFELDYENSAFNRYAQKLQQLIKKSPMRNRSIEMIKAKTLGAERCPNCSNELQQLDNLKYCGSCRECPAMIDDYLRQPNYNIKQNIIQLKSKGIGKIENHVRDIFCKLNMRATQSQTNSISEKVAYMHRKRGPNRKGYKQQTAAVIFKQFHEQFRMNMFQFCTKTGIVRKKFNKMYTQYEMLLKQSRCQQIQKKGGSAKQQVLFQQSDHSMMKQEQNLYEQQEQYMLPSNHNQIVIKDDEMKILKKEQQPENQDYKDEVDNQNRIEKEIHIQINGLLKRNPTPTISQNQFNLEQERQTIRKTVDKIYDLIFTSFYLNKFKKQLINSIVQKSAIISQMYLESKPINYLKKYFRIPSILYCVIKMNGYKIGCKKYIGLVQKHLDVKITENMISKFTSLCKIAFSQHEEDQQVSSPTTLENRNNESSRHQTPSFD